MKSEPKKMSKADKLLGRDSEYGGKSARGGKTEAKKSKFKAAGPV